MSSGGWLMWQCTSTSPGVRTFPLASTTAASRGIRTVARAPAARIRSSSTTTIESSTGAAPVPSIKRAPTMAVGRRVGRGVCAAGPVRPMTHASTSADAVASTIRIEFRSHDTNTDEVCGHTRLAITSGDQPVGMRLFHCIELHDTPLAGYTPVANVFVVILGDTLCRDTRRHAARGDPMHGVLRGLFGSVLLLLLTSAIASAQQGSTGQISGTVKDTSGGVMPGADVSATQIETGFKRTVVTDGTGAYTLTNLPIGPYKLDCNLQGFKSYSRTGIVLQVNSSPTVNIELSLGAVEETVLVQAEAPMIETRNMGVGQVMDNKRIQELPLNGRNPADLLQYLPAAVPQPALNATSRSFGGTQGGLAYAIAGGQSYGVAYILDGATHNNPYDNLNLPMPFPDALQEFKVETSALTAQNGMHSGAAVNAVTKSGTNHLHGDLFEFVRNYKFNARNFFAT